MANPCRPFSRAAAMFSSGLDTPSPEKKVWVCRSTLKAIAGRLIWAARNATHPELPDRFYEEGSLGRRRGFAVAVELHVVEPAIIDGLLQELPVGANILDETLVHDNDLIG